MSHKPISLAAVPMLLLLSAHVPGSTQPPTLKRLQALAGHWSLLDGEGKPTDLQATYRVVAGGSAVMETLFTGTPEETVTLYHLDGARVTATQVSARGRPRKLVYGGKDDGETANTVWFKIESKKAQPGQLTRVQITTPDKDQLRVQWSMAPGDEGAEPEVRAFRFRREAPLAALSAEVARLRVSLESLQRELDRRLKRAITVREKGQPTKAFLETRTLASGPGWSVSGTPLKLTYHDKTVRYASTFASRGDKGMTVAHYGFKAGPGCRLKFSVLGGHGFIAVVEETRTPPRKIRDIPDFAIKLDGGTYGTMIEKIVGGHWTKHARAVEWDLSKFEGKSLRLYMVDAVTNHFGQIALSEVSILEDASR